MIIEDKKFKLEASDIAEAVKLITSYIFEAKLGDQDHLIEGVQLGDGFEADITLNVYSYEAENGDKLVNTSTGVIIYWNQIFFPSSMWDYATDCDTLLDDLQIRIDESMIQRLN